MLAKSVCIALLALLATPSLAGARCAPRDDDVHAPWRLLTWEDFRARLDSRRTADAATTKTGLILKRVTSTPERDGDEWVAKPENVCVYSVMYKLESGYAEGGRNGKNLRHGQLRFDLTEIFARRLYRRIVATQLRGPEPRALKARLEGDIEKMYQETLQEWIEAMEAFNKETDFGRSKRAEKKWARQVEEWLEEVPPVP